MSGIKKGFPLLATYAIRRTDGGAGAPLVASVGAVEADGGEIGAHYGCHRQVENIYCPLF